MPWDRNNGGGRLNIESRFELADDLVLIAIPKDAAEALMNDCATFTTIRTELNAYNMLHIKLREVLNARPE